jgi:hypothetical protein
MRREIKKAMLKIKTTIAALAALAVCAIAASSASAGWFIEGEELAAGSKAALATTAAVDETLTLKVPTIPIELTCTGGTNKTLLAKKPEIEGKNKAYVESLKFTGCSVKESTLCTTNETIETLPILTTTVEGAYPEDKLVVSPKNKTLAFLEFLGTNCALAGDNPLKGEVTLKMPTGQEEQATQAIEGLGSTENNSLELGADKAYIDGGKTLLKLESGKEWLAASLKIGLVKPASGELRFTVKEETVEFKNEEPVLGGVWVPSKPHFIGSGDTEYEAPAGKNKCTGAIVGEGGTCTLVVKYIGAVGKAADLAIALAPRVILEAK